MAIQTSQQVLAAAFESAQKRKQFYYEPTSRLQLVGKLQHLSRFSDFLVVITGPEGAGKTTLLEQLQVAESESKVRACVICSAGRLALSDLLAQLAVQVSGDVPADATDQLLLTIIDESAAMMAAERIQWIIMVDDAMQLTDEAFAFLLQLISMVDGPATTPHLMLLGMPELLPRVQAKLGPESLDRQLHHLELEAFTADEASAYLLQRYSAAGSLSAKQLQAVYEASNGQPGGLNQAVEDLFRSGSVSRSPASAPLPRLHLISVAVVLVGILAISLWQYWPAGSEQGDVARTRVQLNVPPVQESIPLAAEADVPVLTIPATAVADNADRAVSDSVAVSALTADPVVQEIDAVAADRVEVVGTVAPVVVERSPFTDATPVVPSAVTAVRVPAQPVVAAVEEGVVGSIETSSTQVSPSAEQAVVSTAPAAVVEPQSPPPAAASGKRVFSANEAALMAWPASSYTLQLLGAAAQDSAENFIKRQAEPQKFYLFTASYKNKPWYVVVYGQYKDRKSAASASLALPENLRKLKPWARSVQGIQADIEQRKQ